MPQTVLLLLSLLTVQCGGCDFELEGVKNVKRTIESNPTGFVSGSPLTLYLSELFLDFCLFHQIFAKEPLLCEVSYLSIVPQQVIRRFV